MALRRSRDGGLNAWPGYVDALSTLLMVIIFVLLVFVLAQGFLSVVLSSRDRALDRLNRQVSELAEMLALERGDTQALRASLERTAADVRIATAARDLATELLREARQDAARLAGERDAAAAARGELQARIADLDRASRGGGDRLAALEGSLADALARAEAVGGDAARVAAQLTETRAALATERAALATMTQRLATAGTQLEAAARRQAATEAALGASEQRAATLDRALADARGAAEAQAAGRRTAETRVATVEAAAAATARALDAERTARQAAESRAATAERQLAEVRTELATATRRAQETQAARTETSRQLDATRAELAALDTRSRAERAAAEARAAELARVAEQVRALTALRDQLERQVREAEARTGDTDRRRAVAETEAREQTRLGEAARAQVTLLGRQLEELRAQLGRVAAALDAAEAGGRDKDAQLATLGARLNAALAARVEELQLYRSDFFGRLREVLGDRPEMRIVGDRFVFQSEVLFPPAAAEPTERGREQIRALGRVVAELSEKIPRDVNWLLRVDGHADRSPIRGGRYVSNWELSAARAIAVSQLLIADGLPRDRVAAAAFGDNQPLDPGDAPESYARNRRIELRLTDR